ncbi:DUF4123 domain-containing protein [Stenotrophomonas maltophilia]|uniref:DUF4123 domain-containing protein n=1 Tax=Stenotrophomonas maltophilia TaxID=40324 RepID=UPI0015DFF6E6|nr:DUF4123 domain-containing protein [Stenotrophomonas maltophilia]MBA0448762.1 DUF4123 domain-containing protein [Stenotrophomonas maltophilia]
MIHHSLESLVRDVGERLHGVRQPRWAAAVIDPFVHDPFDDGFLADLGAAKIRINVPLRDRVSSRLPYLLLLEATSHGVALLHTTCLEALEEQRDSEREAEHGFAIGPWIGFDSHPDEVVRHWAMICTIRVAGQGRRYLRLADRRVLKWLWRRLDAAQQAFMAGPMTQILVLGRDSSVAELHVPMTPRGERSEHLWNFDVTMLDDCEAVQSMLRGWARFAPALPENYLELAEFALSEARAAGAQGLHDQVLLGAYALQVDNHVLRSPELRNLVAASQAQGANLALALSAVPDSRWDAMAMSVRQGGSGARHLETTQGERSYGFR